MLPKFFDNREWASIYLVLIYNGLVQSITGFGNIDGKGVCVYTVQRGGARSDVVHFYVTVFSQDGVEFPDDIVPKDEFDAKFLGNGKYARVVWNKFTLTT